MIRPGKRLPARDRGFLRNSNIWIIGPIEVGDPDAAEVRLRGVLAQPELRRFRMLIDHETGRWGNEVAVEDLIELSSESSRDGLFAEMGARGFEKGFAIHLGLPWVGFRFNHAYGDGIEMELATEAILTALLGPAQLAGYREPEARLPVLRGVLRAGLLKPRTLVQAWDALRYQGPLPRVHDKPAGASMWSAAEVSVADVQRLRRGTTASFNAVLMTALRLSVAELLDPEHDLLTLCAVNNRRFLPTGKRVSGNFSSALVLGHVREEGLTAEALTARLQRDGVPGAGMIRLAMSARAQQPIPDEPGAGPALTYTALPPEPYLAGLPWVDGVEPQRRLGQISQVPTGIVMGAARIGSRVWLSIVDDSSLLDVDALARNLQARIENGEISP